MTGVESGACAELRSWSQNLLEARLVAKQQGSRSFLPYLAGRACLGLLGCWQLLGYLVHQQQLGEVLDLLNQPSKQRLWTLETL